MVKAMKMGENELQVDEIVQALNAMAMRFPNSAKQLDSHSEAIQRIISRASEREAKIQERDARKAEREAARAARREERAAALEERLAKMQKQLATLRPQ